MAKMTDASMADAYRDEMTGISFTEEEKTNMAARLAAQMKAGETPAPGGKTNDAEILQMRPSSRARRPRRLAAAAVAAGLVLTIGFGGYAYASGQLVSVSDLVRQAFGGGPAETEIVNKVVHKAGVAIDSPTGGILGEKPMWMADGERTTVINTKRLYPGLYASGMAANNVQGGFRMGPIFGGMIKSGRKVAELVAKDLGA